MMVRMDMLIRWTSFDFRHAIHRGFSAAKDRAVCT